MTVTSEREAAASVAPPADATGPEVGLLDEVLALSRDMQVLAEEHLQLATLEAKLAGRSLLMIIAAALAIALLLVGAWFGLMAAMVLWLVGLGLAVAAAILVLVALNLAAAIVLLRLIRQRSRRLGFPATVRSLKVMTLHRSEAESS